MDPKLNFEEKPDNSIIQPVSIISQGKSKLSIGQKLESKQ
jgi:hypothetical protein